MIAPFAAWKPDTPNFGSDATVAKGCVPRTLESYGPFLDIYELSGALGARCQGAASYLDNSNNVNFFAADATKLYLLAASTFGNVSQAGNYSFAADASILFLQHSTATNRIVALGDINTNIQSYSLGSSSLFADLSSGAPRARFGALVDPGIIMVGNTWDATSGYVQNRVWWHDITNNDPTNWPTPGGASAQAAQSDYRDLTFGGPIMGVTGPVGGSASGMVLCRSAVYRATFAGAPSVYNFFALSYEIGTPASNSIVASKDRVYWWSEAGFMASDGAALYPIGAQKIDQYFRARLDTSYMHRIYGVADPLSKNIYWMAPDGTSGTGNPYFIVCYNTELDRWTLPIDGTEYEMMFRAFSLGYTLDQLDAFGNLDTLTFSFDSAVWQGGRPLVGGFSTAHKYGSFTGNAVACVIETGEIAGEQGVRPRAKGLLPIVDGASGSITCAIGYRDTPYGTVNYTTATGIEANGICPQNISARFMRGRLSIAAATTWAHAYGIEPFFAEEGKR